MIDAAVVRHHLARLARAAPGAFRDDSLFRYTALGAGLALLASFANFGHPAVSVPAAPPPPATLGASYTDRSGAAASKVPGSASSPSGPIAPSRSLGDLTITQDPRGRPDRFGTLRAAQPHAAEPRKETP